MKKFLSVLSLIVFSATAALAAEGLVSIKSAHDVKTTADRLESSLKSKGMIVFARVNHGSAAEKVGITLRPTVLVIFGNPKAGSPLMACASTTGIDLPQKALIWQDESGQVWISYNDPDYIARRHGISECAKAPLAKVAKALNNFSRAAATP